jgi:hypothetical protein
MRLPRVSAALLVALSLPGAASAATITVTFTGTVNFVAPQLSAFFTVGDPVSGSFQIDSDVPDLLPADPVVGLYPSAGSNFAFDFGGYSASATGPGGTQVRVENNAMGGAPFDRFVGSKTCNNDCTAATLDIWSLVNMTFLVSDSTAAVFSDDSIPTSFDLTDFNQRSASLEFIDPERTAGPTVSALLTAVTYTVPEPGALALLALGMGIVVAFRRHLPRGGAANHP